MNALSNRKFFIGLVGATAAALCANTAFADRDHDRDRGRYEHRDAGRVYDNRYHHDRYYWPRGHQFDVVPRAAITLRFHGDPYYFHGGIWYRPLGPRFIVTAPPLGIVVPVLPPFYTTLWVRGVPYYYANDTYYVWRPALHGYVVTAKPSDSDVNVAPAPASDDLFVYPNNGQSKEQQDTDRYECHVWATQQTHYDPTRPGGGVAPDQATGKRADYFRAMSACLEGRGYTVK